LIVWNSAEALQRARELRALGYVVAYDRPSPPELVRTLQHRPPDAVVIDLSRLPSQGRDLGVLLRRSPPLRKVPLVFVGGSTEKVKAVRGLLPDATYATWKSIARSLGRALTQPPKEAVVPSSVFAAYAGRPLPLKLGITAGMKVALVGGPAGFRVSLRPLPERASVWVGLRGRPDLVLWFVRTAEALRGIRRMASLCGPAPLWILWPKKTSSLASDLSQVKVRAAGLRMGLVDYKICSVDAVWSGLLFRKRRRPGRPESARP
jgi:CheY-like chemotaxis protein